MTILSNPSHPYIHERHPPRSRPGHRLTPAQTERRDDCIPVELPEQLAPELTDELLRGKIYGYRFRLKVILKQSPLTNTKGPASKGKQSKVMIDNNLFI